MKAPEGYEDCDCVIYPSNEIGTGRLMPDLDNPIVDGDCTKHDDGGHITITGTMEG